MALTFYRSIAIACFALTASVSQAALIGDGSNNVFFFQGLEGPVSTTIVNAYTGQTVAVNGSYNVNQETYDGMGGTDTLYMTNLNDFALIEDPGLSGQVFKDVEVFFSGDGADIINLSSTTYTLGDVTVDAGAQADVIWSNAGNDLVNGRGGDDSIDAGPGNDRVYGGFSGSPSNSGNDTIHGGLGADFISAQDGADTLMFSVDDTEIIGGSVYNVTHDVFDGGSSFDTLKLTDSDDALYAVDAIRPIHPDAVSSVRMIGIERIDAGDGNDIVDLNDPLFDDSVIVNAGPGNDVVNTSLGWDLINGGEGDDTINAGPGNDEVLGGEGNDVLNAGSGNNVIRGGADDDTYLWFNIPFEDNNNVIEELTGFDVIRFEDTVTLNDLVFTDLNGFDLLITIPASALGHPITSTLRLQNQLVNGFDGIEQLFFAIDQSTFDLADLFNDPDDPTDVPIPAPLWLLSIGCLGIIARQSSLFANPRHRIC